MLSFPIACVSNNGQHVKGFTSQIEFEHRSINDVEY